MKYLLYKKRVLLPMLLGLSMMLSAQPVLSGLQQRLQCL